MLKHFSIFQCYHQVAAGNETFDVLSHHFKENAADLHLELCNRMIKNIQYVTKVGWYILGHKKLIPDQYINYMTLPTTPLDEIGLVLFARMKKIHIAFLMEEKYWTTQCNHDLKKCTIVLAFRGNLTFNDTRKKQPDLPKPAPAYIKHQYELHRRQSSKDNCLSPSPPPLPSHSKETPKSSPVKVVIRTHGIPKKPVLQ